MPSGGGENSYMEVNNRFIWQEGGLLFTKQGNGWGIKRKNPQALIGGFSKNLNLRFFFRTVNQAGFSGICGFFSDIGYQK